MFNIHSVIRKILKWLLLFTKFITLCSIMYNTKNCIQISINASSVYLHKLNFRFYNSQELEDFCSNYVAFTGTRKARSIL